MKTISIKQPWASLICTASEDDPQLGIKDIENRTWPTKFRGRVLVHASAKKIASPFDLLTNEQYDSISQENRIIANNSLEYGAIIGSVEIVDCVVNHPSIWAEKASGHYPFPKQVIYNWVLANPVLFAKPITNVKGKLSFWDFDIESEFIGIYSDGKDYSHLEVNGFTDPEHEECVMCGSTQTTITPEADICHDCGFIYT